MKKQKRGFTLLEILLVIALIGILASIVLVAINPNNQLAQARNTVRFDDITEVNQALENYFVANRAYPAGITTSYQDICPVGVTTNCVNLSALVPTYMPAIPKDPTGGNYQVALNPTNGQISLKVSTGEIGATIAINPFSPSLTWAKKATVTETKGINYNNGTSTVVSLSDGSSIVTGLFNGTAVFGAGETGAISLTSAGSAEMFIAKYNADGSLAWAKRAGGTNSNIPTVRPTNIKTFVDGTFVVTGDFTNTITFAPGETGAINLTSTGKVGFYLAKYNTNGTLIWAKKAVAVNIVAPEYIGRDTAYGLGTFADGTSIITGMFSGQAILGEGESNQTSFTSVDCLPSCLDRPDIFIAKYNANGSLAWAKQVSGLNNQGGKAIHTFADNSFMVAGFFTNEVTFGTAPNTTTLSVSGNNYTIFIAKYNADGSLAWAKSAGGAGYDDVSNIIGFSDGSSIITGWAGGSGDSITFAPGESNQTILSNLGGPLGYVAKYNANGSLAWVKKFEGTGWDYATGSSALSDGSVILTGFFQNTITIDGSAVNLTSVGGYDILTAKYNADGSFAWAKRAGGIGDDYGDAVVVNIDGSIVSVGEFISTATFGDTNQISLTSTVGPDMYMVKYKADGSL
jgi:prepilin-type N-terminal cleavage/methylation domain-containing protein